jgi:hypothetical protein
VIEFKTLAKAASFFSNLLRAGRITILNSDLQSASARNPQHVRRNEVEIQDSSLNDRAEQSSSFS